MFRRIHFLYEKKIDMLKLKVTVKKPYCHFAQKISTVLSLIIGVVLGKRGEGRGKKSLNKWNQGEIIGIT